jgi:hypothetical protein
MGGLLGYITVAKPKKQSPNLGNARQGLGKSNNFLGLLFDTKNEILCIVPKNNQNCLKNLFLIAKMECACYNYIVKKYLGGIIWIFINY